MTSSNDTSLEKEISIRGSRLSTALVSAFIPLIASLSTVVSISTGKEAPLWGWVMSILGWSFYIVTVFLSPYLYKLTLGHRTFTAQIVFRTQEFLWADIEPGGFHGNDRRLLGIPILRLVGITFIAGSAERTGMRSVIAAKFGSHWTFPHVFPGPRAALVSLLNDWQSKHGSGRSTASITG